LLPFWAVGEEPALIVILNWSEESKNGGSV